MAEPPGNPLQRPLADGVVPEEVVARTESHWAMIMAAMLVVMMAVPSFDPPRQKGGRRGTD